MSEGRGNDSAVGGPQTPGPQEGSPNSPHAELYEEYEYEYNVSFEGLSANKYSIVIGFWIGLAAFIVFLFTALALMVNMTNRSALRGAGCELSHERRRWHRGSSSGGGASPGGAARLVLDQGGPDCEAGLQGPGEGDPGQGDPGQGDLPEPRSPPAAPPRAPPRRPGGSGPPPIADPGWAGMAWASSRDPEVYSECRIPLVGGLPAPLPAPSLPVASPDGAPHGEGRPHPPVSPLALSPPPVPLPGRLQLDPDP
ncbi:basic proline-rich protein-like [Lethenteron reissneri]|uniref:basic proline-rich protein-like n=1 Tax=Lethenteron reissneri TaxID=7753 RepID=UPI002AB6DCA1|nr:basic proline-rich protein-like [Lethenteron reissneri]